MAVMVNWYTFTTGTGAAAPPAPQASFERLWLTALFRSPDACLFAGSAGPRGLRHYLAIPDVAEDRVQNLLRTYRAEPLQGVPDDAEVALLVGNAARATALWEERVTCSRENPGACVACSA